MGAVTKIERGLVVYVQLLHVFKFACIYPRVQESIGGWRTKWVSPDALVVARLGSTNNASQPALSGLLLYNHLIEYFAAHLKGLRDASDNLQDEALLRYYTKEWDRYTTGASFINRLFSYLNRHWVQRERDEGRKGVYTVYTLALVQWKQHFFLYIQNKNQRLANTVLRLIENQRSEKTIDAGLVKNVVDSFVSLGVDDLDPDKASFDVYEEHFEIPLINAVEKYYRHESEALLAEKSIREYLKKVEEWLKEEEDRVERYMNNITRKALLGMFAVLIREHVDEIWKDFQDLLDSENYEDLRWMYALLARIHEDLEPLRKKFEEHVKKAGLAAVARLTQGDEEDSCPTHSEMEPKAYVDALLEVHAKSQEIVNRSFKGEAGFAASLDRACKDFVNKNTATGTSSTKSPELLAKHTDALLRKNNKVGDDKDLEDALNKVMTLFKYIEDKDVFQTFYTIRLSKRLIHGVSASDEAEASMIAKLKEACGFEYTKTLQRMFMDMSLSKDLTNSFREKMAQTHDESELDVEFSVMVLGTNFWPLTAPRDEFVLPKDILPTYERFTRYFGHRHQGRKLIWLWNYSKNELRTSYLKEKYILTCSSYQMAVLVQYNDQDTLSLDELLEATGIDKESLVQVLGVLVKARILINKEQDQYDLNPSYKSKKIRVNINLPTKTEVKAESANVLKTVVEDRKYVIQATIVRVMKARKQLRNQQLIQEVTAQISQRFTPRVPDIKKAIDTLLQKGYIERVEGQPDLFNYVA
ncbi:hypothetical protein FS837_011526 [Tulasnella sp. UAMH 9824]|nr:hypothetical protein FS837_011526 [Tulasnella sp. UAMH 9824]